MDLRPFFIAAVAVAVVNICQAAHRVETNPTAIGIGLTKRFEVLCSFTRDSSSVITSLLSLHIAHSPKVDSPKFSLIASINSNDNVVRGVALNNAANVSGVINNNGESFIRIAWNYPQKFNGGRYRCRANGVNSVGKVLDSIKGQIVTASAPTIESLVAAFLNLDKTVDQIQARVTDYNNVQRGRVNISASLRTQFEVSDVFRGRRYYLNTRTYWWTANDAHFRCHMYGGYLAEIDDSDEFDFVRNFLILKAQKFYEILLGGSDEAVEGQWMYVYSNRPAKYFNWTVGQPDGGRGANNLCIWRDLRYYMSDCTMMLSYDYSYLCEIPEANVPY